MRQRVTVFILMLAMLSALLPGAALGAPETGVWVLETVEDEEAQDREVSDEDAMYEARVDYTYARGSYAIDWRTVWEEYNVETDGYDTYNSTGELSAVFTGPPERFAPGETVTVSARFSSGASTDYYDLSEGREIT